MADQEICLGGLLCELFFGANVKKKRKKKRRNSQNIGMFLIFLTGHGPTLTSHSSIVHCEGEGASGLGVGMQRGWFRAGTILQSNLD